MEFDMDNFIFKYEIEEFLNDMYWSFYYIPQWAQT